MSVSRAGFVENSHSTRFELFQRWAGPRSKMAFFSPPPPVSSMLLVTTDQRLSDQQNISAIAIAVVVLVAGRNKLEFLLPLAPELRKVLEKVKLGEVRRVGV